MSKETTFCFLTLGSKFFDDSEINCSSGLGPPPCKLPALARGCEGVCACPDKAERSVRPPLRPQPLGSCYFLCLSTSPLHSYSDYLCFSKENWTQNEVVIQRQYTEKYAF